MYLSIAKKQGEFYSISHPVEAPCEAPVIPPASTANDTVAMMYVWVSTLVPDSAGFVYQEAGILTYNITQNSSFVSARDVLCFFIIYIHLTISFLQIYP